MNFENLDIHEDLKKAIKEIGYIELTPIQTKAIPYGLEGKDITGLAQTGTGKTIAFLIPVIQKILNEDLEKTSALILAPTRELVIQICDEAKRLLKFTNKKVATIIGGTGYKEQEKDLNEDAEIIVATPGRLIDHIKSGKLDLSHIKFFILDEADRMFDMGFIKDIRYVMKKCPIEKQVMLFSATLSYYVIRLATEYLRDPVEVEVERDRVVTENITQSVIHLGRHEKLAYLTNLILKDQTEGLGIIFTNLKVLVPEIVNTLRNYGIPITGISSQLDQKKRIRLLKDFKLGKYRYMVATDVASRGIDVDNIFVVYNYDLPSDIENYVHRIGRTARAGKKGISISFCSEKDYVELDKIEKYIGNKLEIMQVDENYLKFPDGDFQKFTPPHGEKEIFEGGAKDQNDRRKDKHHKGKFNKQPYKNKPYSKYKTESTEETVIEPSNAPEVNRERENKNSKNKNFKNRKHHDKIVKNPLDEAMDLLQKADSVLGTEKVNQPKNFEKPNKKKDYQKNNRPPNKKEIFSPNEVEQNYDKSKRNLFDINDIKNENIGKKTFWQKVKSFFGL
jgi:ATP-dependent RNA helicase RhlB